MRPTTKPDLKTFVLYGLAVAALGAALTFLLGEQGPGHDTLTPDGHAAEGVERAGGELLDPPGALSAADWPEAGSASKRVPIAGERSEVEAAGSMAVSSGAEGPATNVRGRVVDEDGDPVPNAAVLFVAGDEIQGEGRIRSASSDADGAFVAALGGGFSGELEVQVRARGYRLLNDTIAVPEEADDVALEDLVVHHGVVLAGTVVDARGKPVAAARIWRSGQERSVLDGFSLLEGALANSSGLVRTDAEGHFELVHEEPGEFVLMVVHPEQPEGRFQGQTPPAGGEVLDLLLRLDPSVLIKGVVRGLPDDEDGVSVRAAAKAQSDNEPAAFLLGLAGRRGAQTATVGDGGAFEVTGLEPGVIYELQVVKARAYGIDEVACSSTVSAVAGEKDVELQWDPGASVVFRVRDSESAAPVHDVTILYSMKVGKAGLPSGGTGTHAFPTGKVELNGLRPSPPPGDLDLLVTAPMYLDHERTGVVVPASGQVDLGVIKLDRASVVRVRVLAAGSDEPIARARVALVPEDEAPTFKPRTSEGETGSDGWCELPGCASRTATLEVEKSGYAPFRLTGVLMKTTGAGLEEVVHLWRGGSVDVEVVDTSGQPARQATVYQRGARGASTTKLWMPPGPVSFTDLSPGKHHFRARHAGTGAPYTLIDAKIDDPEEGWSDVFVKADSTLSLVLEVPLVTTLEGIVRATGAPAPQAELIFLNGDHGSVGEEFLAQTPEAMELYLGHGLSRIRADLEGRFRFVGVPIGRHRLRVLEAAGVLPVYLPVEIVAGANWIEIELPTGAIEGRVLDASGAPIAGATVRGERASGKTETADQTAERLAAIELFGGRRGHGVVTGADGTFTIRGIQPDVPFVLEAGAEGFLTSRSPERGLKEDEVRRGVRIVLQTGGSLHVRIRGEAHPVAVTARYMSRDGVPSESKTAFTGSGLAVLSDLRPGTWLVSLTAGGSETAGVPVEVRAGEPTFVEVDP